MIERRWMAVGAACTLSWALPGQAAGDPSAPFSCGLVEKQMTNDEITIRETTQLTLSGHYVGVGNIWERELPDQRGVTAPRMSAVLSIMEIASSRQRHEKVCVGSVVELAVDRYCVIAVEEGQSEPGSITLRRLAR